MSANSDMIDDLVKVNDKLQDENIALREANRILKETANKVYQQALDAKQLMAEAAKLSPDYSLLSYMDQLRERAGDSTGDAKTTRVAGTRLNRLTKLLSRVWYYPRPVAMPTTRDILVEFQTWERNLEAKEAARKARVEAREAKRAAKEAQAAVKALAIAARTDAKLDDGFVLAQHEFMKMLKEASQ